MGAEGAPEWGGTLGDRGRSPRKKATVAESRGHSEKPRGGWNDSSAYELPALLSETTPAWGWKPRTEPFSDPAGLGGQRSGVSSLSLLLALSGRIRFLAFSSPSSAREPSPPPDPLSAPLSYSHPPAPAREDPAVQGAHLQSPGWPPSHREGLGSEPRTQSPGDTR